MPKERQVVEEPRTVSEKLSGLPRVVSSELADRISRLRSSGKEVITLNGAPYWAPPDHVLEAATQAGRKNENAPSNGFRELRTAIAEKLNATGVAADPDSELVITNGAMHGLSLVYTTLLDPGSEVILFRPSFFFFGVIQLAGGVPVYAETTQHEGWRWNVPRLEAAITPRTRMIMLNSPMNPTGYVASEGDLLAIAEVARRHNLIVVSDECYDNMVYDGAKHIRVASIPELQGRTVTVCSFTKTLAMQPWRIGFIAAPRVITAQLHKVLEWTALRCSHVAQRAAQAALEGPQAWVSEIAARFQRGRDLMIEGLRSARGLSFTKPQAGPFLFVGVSETGLSGAEFSRLLLNSYGVPTDAGEFFCAESYVRLAFGAPDDVIRMAAERITDASSEAVPEPVV